MYAARMRFWIIRVKLKEVRPGTALEIGGFIPGLNSPNPPAEEKICH